MQSRAMRLILAAVCCIAGVATATFVLSSEQQIADRRVSERVFDQRAREATEALADLRTAQQAYVAAGQGVAFWMSKVDATMETVANTLATLQQSATIAASKAALDETGTTLHEFGDVDKRIRGYLESGAQLMAADIIFTEGGEAVASAARQVESARLEEQSNLDRFAGERRKQEAQALAGAGGLIILIVVALALSPRKPAARADPASPDRLGAPSELLAPREPITPRQVAPWTTSADKTVSSTDETLPMRREASPEPKPAEPKPAEMARPVDVAKRAAGPALKAAAQLCTDLGRVSDSQELRSLIGRAADMLDASGLVLWMGTAAGDELRPAVAHGYDSQMVARIPSVPRSANNAAATAYRTATLQIVLSRPGSAKGAVVAPVVSADGCIGVLSAEIRDGGEASETVQALAAIIAAQLAGVLGSTPAPNQGRSTGSAAM
jgi:hypothetical protein